jgi:molybdate transport system ATP-binding protein
MSISFALRHRFPSIQMDIAFEVRTPGVTVLFGPSGSGKSTIINAAAGLLRPEICRIEVDGTVLADTRSGLWLSPERRGAGGGFPGARLLRRGIPGISPVPAHVGRHQSALRHAQGRGGCDRF